jgi:hypothetical protein
MQMSWTRSCAVVLSCVASSLAWSGTSRAFTIQSALSEGCHEQMTVSALRTVRGALGTAVTITPDRNEQALIKDLPFELPSDMNELAAASLLVGIRDNDLKGRAPTEIDQLATVHGNPDNQEEHCLRAEADDEPNGSAASIARCRAFIHDRAMSAVDALAADGTPDPNVRDQLDVSLALRGRVKASLPAFWIRAGQAMHALQDSFAHAYRDASGKKVNAALNWIDVVNKVEVESRDGPPHKSDMDKCNAGDATRSLRRSRPWTCSRRSWSPVHRARRSRRAWMRSWTSTSRMPAVARRRTPGVTRRRTRMRTEAPAAARWSEETAAMHAGSGCSRSRSGQLGCAELVAAGPRVGPRLFFA